MGVCPEISGVPKARMNCGVGLELADLSVCALVAAVAVEMFRAVILVEAEGEDGRGGETKEARADEEEEEDEAAAAAMAFAEEEVVV